MTSTPRARSEHPTAPPDIDAYLARFAWHPEPELIGYRDEEASRGPMTTLAADTWTTALDFLYGHAADRAMGDTRPHDVLRRAYHGGSGPGPAPADPMTARAVLDEFQQRIAGGLMNSQHPRQFGYFTPPPLPMSMMGELLAQMTNQGVDVWHAGPVAAFVEEEVVRWLCDIVGYDDAGFGLLTSGGVMANFMAMALARDVHLARLVGDGQPPRGAMLDGVRVYTSDQTHFSIARALDLLGFPRETLVVVEADERFHLRAAPVAAAVMPRPCRRPGAVRDRRRRRFDEHRVGRCRWRTRRCRRRRGPVAPRGRGLRRSGPSLDARRRPRPRPRASGFGHGRSAQMVLPGLRHRRLARPRRGVAGPGVRWPRTRVLPRRRDAGTERGGARRDRARARRPRRPGPAQLLQARASKGPAAGAR